MKILIVLPDLGGGGAERVSLNLANYLKNHKFEVIFLITSERGELLNEARSRFRVVAINCSRFRKAILPISRAIDALAPDIVLANMWPLTVITTIACRTGMRKPRILCIDHIPLLIHDAAQSILNRLIVRLSVMIFYPFAHAVIGVSNGVTGHLKKLAYPIRLDVNTIYNPVLINDPDAEVNLSSSTVELNSFRKLILSVGSLKKQKNHLLLIKAFVESGLFTDFDLVIVGEGPERQSLEFLIRELGMMKYIHLIGFSEDTYWWYRRAELFVLSSDYEGLPTVLIEALSVGLTVVSTDCPYGPAEILQGGKYGYLVKTGDVNYLANSMRYACMNKIPPDVAREGVKRFSIAEAGKSYLSLFHSSGTV